MHKREVGGDQGLVETMYVDTMNFPKNSLSLATVVKHGYSIFLPEGKWAGNFKDLLSGISSWGLNALKVSNFLIPLVWNIKKLILQGFPNSMKELC